MSIRTAFPWISLLVLALSVLNPIGLDFLYLAFFSGEQLSRNIALPIVLISLASLLSLTLIEFGLRVVLIRRRATGGVRGKE
jgi:hypothetical protein